MKIKKAAGWILINPESQVLLLRNRQRQEWGLPKGHLEKGESELEAAYRELEEETGIKPDEIDKNSYFQEYLAYYLYSFQGSRLQKTVTYFTGQCHLREISLSSEHDQFLWASWPNIQSKIMYPQLRKLILKALKSTC